MEKVATGMKIDPRGQRFSAALSTVVLAVALVTGSVWLLAFQAVVFGIGAVAGMAYAPYGMIYRWLVRPRLGPPSQMEDAAGPRFAQGVGGGGGAHASPPAPRSTRQLQLSVRRRGRAYHRGKRLVSIRNSSIARAHCRPSRIAQTTSD